MSEEQKHDQSADKQSDNAPNSAKQSSQAGDNSQGEEVCQSTQSNQGTASQVSEKSGNGSALVLHIPEGVRYNCQGCGRCCSGWSVGMSQEDYDRIKHVDWQSLHPALKGRELFMHREAEYKAGLAGHPHYTKPREDGSCPFLIDKLCFIHGYLGEDQKPVTCRLFPYSFVETPSGVYTGVVYNSMAAAKNPGQLADRPSASLGRSTGTNQKICSRSQ